MQTTKKAVTEDDRPVINRKPLLTPKQASEWLGVPVNRMAIWRITGEPELEFIKCGKSVRYSPEAIEAFIQRNTIKNTGRER